MFGFTGFKWSWNSSTESFFKQVWQVGRVRLIKYFSSWKSLIYWNQVGVLPVEVLAILWKNTTIKA